MTTNIERKAEKFRTITRRLLRWFDANKRTFPWRDTFEKPDPYQILFTEIMLQRTNAKQVVPVYKEFVSRYPTFQELSDANENEIVALFLRLGLRRRARRITKLILELRDTYGGSIPSKFNDLRRLPGLGEYVSRAVECYAFGKRVVPVDTNVVRIISRLFGLSLKPDSGRRSRQISGLAMDLVPKRRIRDFNLALLDFAAAICKPEPRCSVCPLWSECLYFSARQSEVKSTIAS